MGWACSSGMLLPAVQVRPLLRQGFCGDSERALRGIFEGAGEGAGTSITERLEQVFYSPR